MRRIPFAIVVGACLAANGAGAEILHGVLPLTSLGEVRKQYPNANFTNVKAAWVTEAEAFYEMKGDGFPGKLMLAFTDSRPLFRVFAKAECEPEPKPSCDLYKAFAGEADIDALNVNWVRWIPPAPIPISRYKSRYGEPSKIDYGLADMRPYAEWTSFGLIAHLSDDKQQVIFVDTTFTKAEKRRAYQLKGWILPDFLKEETSPSPVATPSRRTTR
jgi:hypothetical protein